MLMSMPDGRRFRLEYGPKRTCRIWEVSASGPKMIAPDPAIAGPDADGWWPIPEAIDYLCLTCHEWAISDDRCGGLLTCTACGESRIDVLIWDDDADKCTCHTCGNVYVPGFTAHAHPR